MGSLTIFFVSVGTMKLVSVSKSILGEMLNFPIDLLEEDSKIE